MDKLLKAGHVYVVDADLANYFGSIPHDKMMERVSESISDGRVLGLVSSWLKQEIMSENGSWKPTSGSPQGAVISPLLANICLHPLEDVLLLREGFKMVRYADDFVVMCESRGSAERALGQIERWVRNNGLSLSAEKTHVGDCRVEGEGFEYFKHAERWIFRAMDGYIRRLRAMLLRNNKKHGVGRSLACHTRWPNASNAYFAERGLFTMHEARLKAIRPQ